MAAPTHTTPSGVNAPAYLDAELIRICDEVADLNRQAEALDDVDEDNLRRWEELSALAATMPAETLDGLRARLRAIGPATLQDNLLGSTMGELKAQMIALADELIRFAVGHTGTPEELRSPILARGDDAELIAACDLFLQRQAEQEVRNRNPDLTDEQNTLGVGQWVDALNDLYRQPNPATWEGCTALAKAGWTALHDQLTPSLTHTLEEQASIMELVALKALAAVGDAA